MVERKVPKLVPSVLADSHPKKQLVKSLENPTSLNQEIKSRGADVAKKMKKSSRGFKQSDLGTLQPNLIKEPNYSKSTTSFDARKELCPPPQTSTWPKPKHVSVNSPHNRTCASSLRLVTTTLTKTTSFKPTRPFKKVALCENVNHVRRATCSSTLKDSKFPDDYLQLNHGGTESDGTSVTKVCPYTYCSLNSGHHHHHHHRVPLLPSKCFSSTMLKNHKGTKLGSLSLAASSKGIDEELVICSPQPQLQEPRVGIEICVKDREDDSDDTNGRSMQIQDDLKAASDELFHAPDDAVSIEFEIISNLFPGDWMEESDQAPIDILLCTQVSQASDMDYLKPQISDIVNQEQSSKPNDAPQTWSEENPHERVLQGSYGEESVSSEAWSGEGDPESNSFYGEMETDDQQTFCTTIDYEKQDQDETEKDFPVCDAAADVNQSRNQILDRSQKFTDHAGNKIEMENKQVKVAESVIRIELSNLPQEISEGDHETTNEDGDEVELIDVAEGNEIMSQISAVSAETQDESSNKASLSSAETQGESSDKKSDIAENQHNAEKQKDSSSDMMEIKVTEASQDTINYMEGQWETNDEFPNSSKYLRGTRGKRLSSELDDFSREFNPRELSFLPLEPDPDAERVDLRHQIMDDKKNAEEWMLDFALRQAVTRLAPARKRKVELLVEAFEKVIPPIPKCQTHLGHTHNHLLRGQSKLAFDFVATK